MVAVEWLKELGIEKELLPVLEAHDMQFFIDLIAKYQLTEKVYMSSNNTLFTFADIAARLMAFAKRDIFAGFS